MSPKGFHDLSSWTAFFKNKKHCLPIIANILGKLTGKLVYHRGRVHLGRSWQLFVDVVWTNPSRCFLRSLLLSVSPWLFAYISWWHIRTGMTGCLSVEAVLASDRCRSGLKRTVGTYSQVVINLARPYLILISLPDFHWFVTKPRTVSTLIFFTLSY